MFKQLQFKVKKVDLFVKINLTIDKIRQHKTFVKSQRAVFFPPDSQLKTSRLQNTYFHLELKLQKQEILKNSKEKNFNLGLLLSLSQYKKICQLSDS